jgi:VanZ family protein
MYGILSSLIYLALRRRGLKKYYPLMLAFAIAFIYGIINEMYQVFLPWRQGDLLDVMANGIGAFSFPLGLSLITHRREA